MEDKIFRFSLTVSFLLHALVIASLFYANFQYEQKKPHATEVVYQKLPPDSQEEFFKKHSIKSIKGQKEQIKPEVFPIRNAGHSPELDSLGKRQMKLGAHKKQPLKMTSLDGGRHIVVPLIESEKISNPKYLNYHDRIRDKIKNRAYFYVDDPRFDVGEVYLTFVLLSDGSLKAIKIIDNKTMANDYLRSVGLQSIKESSPFPPFPTDLKYNSF